MSIQVTEQMLFDYDNAVDSAFNQLKHNLFLPFEHSNQLLDEAIRKNISDKYSLETIKAIDARYLEWLNRNDEVLTTRH